MTPSRQGSFHLFRFQGVDVFLHWSWFLIAVLLIQWRSKSYGSMLWNGIEYLALFVVVLLHEFGHSLACRQVGGTANQIVLWPLGGVAYVDPPPRPGAVLWSIAAGPLVNVGLIFVLGALWWMGGSLGLRETAPDAYSLLRWVFWMNLGLLIFNMFPIYPLDGGQIVRALLWFVVGRARSLQIASVIGLVGVAGLIAVTLWLELFSVWTVVILGFILLNCWTGLRQARALALLAEVPRHDGFACPSCHASPPRGAFWLCGQCRQPLDMFETNATCTRCGAQFAETRCPDCGRTSPLNDWVAAAATPRKS